MGELACFYGCGIVSYAPDTTAHVRTPRGSMSDDESCLDLLEKSLTNCLDSHKLCLEDNQDEWLPTRLLDVQGHDAFAPIFLRERGEIQPVVDGCVKYITLSHRWGGNNFLKLERKTLRAFKRGINLDNLPQTFRDAVGMTRRLKVRYLWIDSLWYATIELLYYLYTKLTRLQHHPGFGGRLAGAI